MLSECQAAWIRVRCQVTWRLIRIQAVCTWYYSRARRSKGYSAGCFVVGPYKGAEEWFRARVVPAD